jgi:hypothetical protein
MPKKIAGNGRKTSMIGRRACCCEHLINSKKDQGIVKPRPAAALALVRRHRLLRGEIDAEIIFLWSFRYLSFTASPHCFSNGSQANNGSPFTPPHHYDAHASESVKSPIISTSVAPPSFAHSGGNELPAFKVGSDWRFDVEEIDRWR